MSALNPIQRQTAAALKGSTVRLKQINNHIEEARTPSEISHIIINPIKRVRSRTHGYALALSFQDVCFSFISLVRGPHHHADAIFRLPPPLHGPVGYPPATRGLLVSRATNNVVRTRIVYGVCILSGPPSGMYLSVALPTTCKPPSIEHLGLHTHHDTFSSEVSLR